MLRQVLGRHPERVGLELESALAAGEGLASDGIDLGDRLVGHGEAAARRAGAVHHQRRAGAAVGAVIGVRIAGVEGEVIGRVRVHLRRGDRVEALRRLPVAFLRLGPELARPAADRIGLEERELAVRAALPDLHLRFLLVGADDDRVVPRHPLLRHERQGRGRNRRKMPRAAAEAFFLTGRERERQARGHEKRFIMGTPLSFFVPARSRTIPQPPKWLALTRPYRKRSPRRA